MENGQLSNEWAEEQNEQYLHDDWADSLGVFIENPEYANTFEDDTSSQQTFPSHEKAKGKEQKKLRKQKNVAHRGSAFTKEEDAVICSAFLHVSKDPIAGVNQSACAYYKRMYDFFCENKPERSTRSQIGIKKGGNLSKRQLVSFLHSNRKLIGEMKVAKNEQDRIDDVVKMYEEKEAFQFLHCWKLLHNEPKWNDKVLELNNTPTRKTQQPEGPCNPVGTQPNTENAAITRPEGRDTAKKRRFKEDTASSSAAVEVLQ
ncbi:uncharacterized protein [Zea mays]|uniref:No apical meristem-associated C-terminal domain-containing protein n=1 Tax=Zea mays TaxID=4577 RepID=A0A1D6EP48_MAIZE|nr:uncharacterized protein LOC103647372 isoform X2 [Zea mays]ONM21556.1 hypothetical protein ZEAMMB73_Zm00001d005617 [Zea mays]|eukprot:XP_008670139.1 uncharacterized protein LOC103647372 isoform X2 [Zea mays]